MSKILIVEDEPAMRLGLKDNLEFESYQVELAIDGAEGLKKATASQYDLIILDVMMPKMSGFDVCKAMRNVDTWRRLYGMEFVACYVWAKFTSNVFGFCLIVFRS